MKTIRVRKLGGGLRPARCCCGSRPQQVGLIAAGLLATSLLLWTRSYRISAGGHVVDSRSGDGNSLRRHLTANKTAGNLQHDTAAVQAERLERVRHMCKQFSRHGVNLANTSPLYTRQLHQHILVSQTNNMLLCTAPNTIPDHWLHSVFANQEQTFQTFDKLSPAAAKKEVLESDVKVALVSHPYQRLHAFYVRANLTHGQLGGLLVTTFQDFLSQISSSSRSASGAEDTSNFMQDPELSPYFDLCNPCRVKYDVIVKSESRQQDLNYLMQKYAIILPEMPDAEKTNWQEAFSKVNREIRKKIKEIFSLDLLFFSYKGNKAPFN